MIGMSFSSFLSLLILGSIAAIVLHFVVLYKMLAGFDGFMNKWIAGWIGGWLGSPVLGHWGPSLSQIFLIPRAAWRLYRRFCSDIGSEDGHQGTHNNIATESCCAD